ncbi:MAG TPA: anti-sigma factor [Terriglobales bacterium]|nr:anti-sigma factor [Terriglobales bacterium]
MIAHEQFAEDLALHALGTLEGDERAALERHLETCSACRLELDQLRGDMALMAMATAGPKPPQRSRQRLLDAIAKEPRVPTPVAARTRFNLWGALGWAAAAGMFLVVVHLRRENFGLRETANQLAQLTGRQTVELANAQRVMETLTAPETQAITLVAAKGPPQPQGKAFYLKNESGLVFVANNLPQLPPDKIYELWLIPPGAAPIPAGLFKPDARGSATVVNPPLPAGVDARVFAVTLEPATGPHDAPRGTGLMRGGA